LIMGKFKTCVGTLFCIVAVLIAALGAFLYFGYKIVDEGDLSLPNAPGVSAIVRE